MTELQGIGASSLPKNQTNPPSAMGVGACACAYMRVLRALRAESMRRAVPGARQPPHLPSSGSGEAGHQELPLPLPQRSTCDDTAAREQELAPAGER